MTEYISREEAVDAGYLSDWYISSVGDEPPVWTDAHIDELLNDFIVIPKDTKATDVQPVKRGRWENEYLEDDIWWAECSNCKQETHSRYGRPSTYRYCPNCGARMDGDAK